MEKQRNRAVCDSKTQQYPPSHLAMPFNAELFHLAPCLTLLQKKEFDPQAGGRATEQNLFVDFLHVTHMILFFTHIFFFISSSFLESGTEAECSLFDNTVKSSL